MRKQRVSVHGGHSGEFCQHARDSLEAVVEAYIAQGFEWVGITEHMPPVSDASRYDDEVAAGLSAARLQARFREYFERCRQLQEKYAEQITLYTAFETEMYEGAIDFTRELMQATRPDYIVGSVHHVAGICIDYDEQSYARALSVTGGLEALYCEYFDAQFTLLSSLKPSVVGHFDLIRIFDKDYLNTLRRGSVWRRVERNLAYMAQESLLLDYNLRGLYKGSEPYPCEQVLREALRLGVRIAPGDDSHGVASVGLHYDEGLARLDALGVTGPWPRPRLLSWASPA